MKSISLFGHETSILNRIALALVLLSISGGTAAQAETAEVTQRVTAGEIEQMLQASGLQPTVVADKNTGAPVAIGKVNNIEFVVRALECEGRKKECGRLLMFVNFELGRDIAASDYEAVNGFNEKSPDGRAYLIESTKEVGVDYIIDLTGGVTADHIKSRLERWPGVIGDFVRDIQKANAGS